MNQPLTGIQTLGGSVMMTVDELWIDWLLPIKAPNYPQPILIYPLHKSGAYSTCNVLLTTI